MTRHHPGRGLGRTLRGRLVLTYVGLFVAVLLMLGVYVTVQIRDLYIDRLTQQLAGQGQIIGAVVGPMIGHPGTQSEIDARIKHLGAGIEPRLTVIDAQGTVLGDSVADPHTMVNHADRPEVISALDIGIGRTQRHSTTLDKDFLYVAIPVEGHAVVRAALALDDVNRTVADVKRNIMIITVLATLLVAVISTFLARRITRPLDILRYQARAVADGHLDATVEPAEMTEIGDLGRSFNMMTSQLRSMLTEIEASRDRMEAILAELGEGIVITTATGKVLQLNQAAARMFRTTVAHAEHHSLIEVSRDHELSELLLRALTTDATCTTTIGTGEEGLVLEASAQKVGNSGDALGLLVLRDITDVQRLERMRREFVANVSHDLRTPITSIKALIETLLTGAMHDPDAASDFLEHIDNETDRLVILVNELLELARLDAGAIALDLSLCDPRDILESTLELVRLPATMKDLELRLEAPPTLLPLHVDRARIERVVQNLIQNAIKFSLPGGEIVVTARDTGDKLSISVSDTGSGIAAADLPRVFERFFMTDKARQSVGTGLGLAIAKHIVQAHGGTIEAESTLGQGSTFTFFIPHQRSPDEHDTLPEAPFPDKSGR